MKNILLVARFEFLSILSKRSFWFSTFLLPILILVLTLGSQFFYSTPEQESESISETIQYLPQNIGIVDLVDLLNEAELPDHFIHYSDEIEARAGLVNGEINSFFLLNDSAILSGEVTLVVGGAPDHRGAPDPAGLAGLVQERETAGATRKEAIASVAKQSGVPKRVVYDAVHRPNPGAGAAT